MKKAVALCALCLALLLAAGLSACKPQPEEPGDAASSVSASPAGEDTWADSAQTAASSASKTEAGSGAQEDTPLKDKITVSVIAPRPDEVSSGSGAAGPGSTDETANAHTSATGSVTSTENPSSQSEWIEGDF